MKTTFMLTVLALAACTAAAPDRPMDEVPVQQLRPNGEREFRFANGCAIVLAPDRAVLRSESGVCELYQRDIALLYASAD